jgi:peroxisomal membrane protein 4
MTHGTNLFKFATIYKTLMLLLRKTQGREHNLDAMLAGGIGGYIVFKENNAINQQMILYLFSRVAVAFAVLAQQKGYISVPEDKNGQVFGYFAAACWAGVMWLFRHHRDTMQQSLAASMVYIYEDSEKWTGLRNFLWHNR